MKIQKATAKETEPASNTMNTNIATRDDKIVIRMISHIEIKSSPGTPKPLLPNGNINTVKTINAAMNSNGNKK